MSEVWQKLQSNAASLMEKAKDESVRRAMCSFAIRSMKSRRKCWEGRKPKWQCDALDLESAELLYKRMIAEERMGLTEEASKTCSRTYSTYVVFLQAHGADKNHPLEKMDDGEILNLETCYRQMVSLLDTKTGRCCAEREKIMSYGREYLSYFPTGRYRDEISRIISRKR